MSWLIRIMESAVLNLQSLHDKMRTQVDLLNENTETSESFMVFYLYLTSFHSDTDPITGSSLINVHTFSFVFLFAQTSFRWFKTLTTAVANGCGQSWI